MLETAGNGGPFPFSYISGVIMSKEEIDVQAVRAKFMQDREKKLDAERQADERDELETGGAVSLAVRGTDGGKPGTKERNPLEVAKNVADEADDEGTNNDGLPTKASKVEDIKAYLDANGIDYTGVTKKDELLALIG